MHRGSSGGASSSGEQRRQRHNTICGSGSTCLRQLHSVHVAALAPSHHRALPPAVLLAVGACRGDMTNRFHQHKLFAWAEYAACPFWGTGSPCFSLQAPQASFRPGCRPNQASLPFQFTASHQSTQLQPSRPPALLVDLTVWWVVSAGLATHTRLGSIDTTTAWAPYTREICSMAVLPSFFFPPARYSSTAYTASLPMETLSAPDLRQVAGWQGGRWQGGGVAGWQGRQQGEGLLGCSAHQLSPPTNVQIKFAG